MTQTPLTKTFLIYIPPSDDISNLLEKANIILRENHPSNTYIPIYNGKWHSHLMVYLSPMPVIHESNIVNAVKKVVTTRQKFTVELAGIEMSEGNYLQVRVAEKSKVALNSIRKDLVVSLAPFRDQTIKSKYLQKWDSFTTEEKIRIKNTGIPYIYEPHLTLGVFGDKLELQNAYNELSSFNFKGLTFEAARIEIQTMFGTDYTNKKIIFSEDLHR